MKAWKLGAEEPSTPQWTYTDPSSLAPGTLAVGAWHWGGATPPGIVDAVFDDLYFTPIPEPAGAALLILGSVGIATVARRRQNAAMFRHLGNAIACGSAILLLACSAQSGEIKIVSPNAWADVEAEGGPAGARTRRPIPTCLSVGGLWQSAIGQPTSHRHRISTGRQPEPTGQSDVR